MAETTKTANMASKEKERVKTAADFLSSLEKEPDAEPVTDMAGDQLRIAQAKIELNRIQFEIMEQKERLEKIRAEANQEAKVHFVSPAEVESIRSGASVKESSGPDLGPGKPVPQEMVANLAWD